MDYFHVFTWFWIGCAVVIFPILLKVTAPYGRHTTRQWGPVMSNTWGWVVQEAPSFLLVTFFFFTGSLPKTHASYFFWALWSLHYIHRSFIFPFRTKTQGKTIPVLIVASAIFFNLWNGILNGYYFGSVGGNYDDSFFTSPRFFTGFAIFLTGVFINVQSDNILLSLRKPGETGYKIPEGGFFRWVSCPNLFGEMVEWCGFAVMVWSLPAFSFALWTVVNLLPRALDHHRWYQSKFPDYPASRKAVIPGLL
ncbi:MAG: 3-oxo-5-alpha-steroid 4-dehydrogenase [Chitinophagales bacterium]